jgi:hypothetical protein
MFSGQAARFRRLLGATGNFLVEFDRATPGQIQSTLQAARRLKTVYQSLHNEGENSDVDDD